MKVKAFAGSFELTMWLPALPKPNTLLTISDAETGSIEGEWTVVSAGMAGEDAFIVLERPEKVAEVFNP